MDSMSLISCGMFAQFTLQCPLVLHKVVADHGNTPGQDLQGALQ